ncbi:MAG TPA: adenylate/guanylate cyclase domain-containing protein [Gammaproteobacteria bacterium]|nr:adenylate/guanylate cyclase domain-containing protein [Gammaproteobacteria bacterium]
MTTFESNLNYPELIEMPLTFMVADIVGSSLIMQKDQRKGVDLYETFQSILVPIIEKAVGFGIEFTGDAISASFRTCKSAVKAGFAIQEALDAWNLSSEGPGITARIGIHSSSKQGEKESQQQLSLAAATSLQSLGRADALCVSKTIIDEITPDFPVYAYPLGRHDLGFLSDTVPVFYLYEEKQAFLRRQGFLLEYLKTEYLDNLNVTIISPVVEIPLLVVATILFLMFASSKPEIEPRYIEVTEIRDFSSGGFDKELSDMASRIQTSVNSIAGVYLLHIKGTSKPDTNAGKKYDSNSAFRLVFSFQQNAERVRLTWGIFERNGKVQVSGGVVTGSINKFAELERQVTENILAWLVS